MKIDERTFENGSLDFSRDIRPVSERIDLKFLLPDSEELKTHHCISNGFVNTGLNTVLLSPFSFSFPFLAFSFFLAFLVLVYQTAKPYSLVR